MPPILACLNHGSRRTAETPSAHAGCGASQKLHFGDNHMLVASNDKILRYLCAFMVCASCAIAVAAQQFTASAPSALGANISGTVIDSQDDVISGATVVLSGPAPEKPRFLVTDAKGGFVFDHVNPGGPYRVAVGGNGFSNWTSLDVILHPSQFLFLPPIRLAFTGGITSVTVHASPKEIATEQVLLEEHQRVLGIVPNFYVEYDPHAAPLTTKLKFSLALKIATDPISILGAGVISGIDQAADTPDYVQGARGYGERFGANYANGLTDTLIGGAILPSILHQDPRYFYQGTGTRRSRILHAVSNPFICRGDNGLRQPNYSSLGGYLASGIISTAYYPESNRGPGLVFGTLGIDIGADITGSLLQEFVLRRLTTSAKTRNH